MAVVSKAEFARQIGVSRPAVSKLIKAGRIPVRYDGKINFEEAVVAYEGSKQIGREVSADNGRKGGRGNISGKNNAKVKMKVLLQKMYEEKQKEIDDILFCIKNL